MRLTIAIPTFNRPDTLLDTLSKLLSFPNSHEVDLLVVDNGSDVDIELFINNKLRNISNLSIIRFDTNEGFHESFYRLFEVCSSDFMMVLSDEDIFDLSRLTEVIKILESKSPNLLVVSSKNKSKILTSSNNMKISSYRIKDESTSISGLIFKTKPVKENLKFFRDMSNSEEFAYLYPSVLVAYTLALSGKCLRFKKAAIEYRTIIPTSIKSARGVSYKLPTERIYQHISLLSCFEKLKSGFPLNISKINYYILFEKMNFFGLIFNSIGFISGRAKTDFLYSSSKFIFLHLVRSFYSFPGRIYTFVFKS